MPRYEDMPEATPPENRVEEIEDEPEYDPDTEPNYVPPMEDARTEHDWTL